MKSTRDWKSFLKDVVEKNNTKAGKTFDLAIQSLIVGSLISFSIETLPDLSERTYDYLFIFEVASIGIFTIEYLLRLYFADSKVNFIFSFYGIMDLIAIVPFYMPINADLRVFRAFRLLRLFKLFRYSKAISHYTRAFSIAKDELVLFGSAALIILYLSAVGIYYF